MNDRRLRGQMAISRGMVQPNFLYRLFSRRFTNFSLLKVVIDKNNLYSSTREMVHLVYQARLTVFKANHLRLKRLVITLLNPHNIELIWIFALVFEIFKRDLVIRREFKIPCPGAGVVIRAAL